MQSDPIGLGGGINTYGYGLGNPLTNIDTDGLQVTKVCRPVPWTGILHCAVFVWHWEMEKCTGKQKKVIDRQFSLQGYTNTPRKQGSNGNFTWDTDRSAFNNPGAFNTNGRNLQADVPVPDGMSQDEFDKAVSDFGDNYEQGDYSLFGFFGPNSNSATNNIIRGGGGKPPNFGEPGADHCACPKK